MAQLFEINDAYVSFETAKETIRALNGFSLRIEKGDILGLVGESGSGKSVAVATMINLLRKPGKIDSGTIYYKDKNLLEMDKKQLNQLRGKEISVIPSGAKSMLHPMLPVGKQISNIYLSHNPGTSKEQAMEKAVEILNLVQIPDARRRITALPGEFSGGMIQRVLIAMALVNNPELVIADDATTGLDVTVQAQVLDLIKEKVSVMGSSAIIITHDLGIVTQYCSKVGILFAGRIVEFSDSVNELLLNAHHPYSRTLLSATSGVPKQYVPEVSAARSSRYRIPEQGCLVQNRCNMHQDICKTQIPCNTEIKAGHWAQCHFVEKGEEPCRKI